MTILQYFYDFQDDLGDGIWISVFYYLKIDTAQTCFQYDVFQFENDFDYFHHLLPYFPEGTSLLLNKIIPRSSALSLNIIIGWFRNRGITLHWIILQLGDNPQDHFREPPPRAMGCFSQHWKYLKYLLDSGRHERIFLLWLMGKECVLRPSSGDRY